MENELPKVLKVLLFNEANHDRLKLTQRLIIPSICWNYFKLTSTDNSRTYFFLRGKEWSVLSDTHMGHIAFELMWACGDYVLLSSFMILHHESW